MRLRLSVRFGETKAKEEAELAEFRNAGLAEVAGLTASPAFRCRAPCRRWARASRARVPSRRNYSAIFAVPALKIS